jgi:hypothetical protein
MDNIEPVKDSISLPVETVISTVRDLRNGIIVSFLIDENLLAYFKSEYNKDLSAVKKEFLKKDLHELLISPVDLVHYSGLIREIKESNNAAVMSKHDALFYQELEAIFKKYSY